MTPAEFEVMDELYFIISYNDLMVACDLPEDELQMTLKSMYEKGWVRVFATPDEDIDPQLINWDEHYADYQYLASKKGLFAHNTD